MTFSITALTTNVQIQTAAVISSPFPFLQRSKRRNLVNRDTPGWPSAQKSRQLSQSSTVHFLPSAPSDGPNQTLADYSGEQGENLISGVRSSASDSSDRSVSLFPSLRNFVVFVVGHDQEFMFFW